SRTQESTFDLPKTNWDAEGNGIEENPEILAEEEPPELLASTIEPEEIVDIPELTEQLQELFSTQEISDNQPSAVLPELESAAHDTTRPLPDIQLTDRLFSPF